MGLKELSECSYSELVYIQFLSNCMLYHEEPIKGDIFMSRNGLAINIYKKKQNSPVLKTKRIVASTEDMKEIVGYIQRDYPNTRISVVEPFDGGESLM